MHFASVAVSQRGFCFSDTSIALTFVKCEVVGMKFACKEHCNHCAHCHAFY